MKPQFFGGILVAGYLILHWLRQRKRKRKVNDVNGIWTPSGYINGKPRYVKDSGDMEMHWEPDGWHIGDDVYRVIEPIAWIAEWDDKTGNQ